MQQDNCFKRGGPNCQCPPRRRYGLDEDSQVNESYFEVLKRIDKIVIDRTRGYKASKDSPGFLPIRYEQPG